MSRGPLTPVIKGIAAGVGLVSEGIAHHREQKAQKKKADELSQAYPASDTVLGSAKQISVYEREIAPSPAEINHVEDNPVETVVEEDEKHWDLDDAQDKLTGIATDRSKKRPSERDPAKIAKHFTDGYPISPGVKPGRLSLPVVLPQRRPKNRTRGFIRAYAPELQQCGIDQAMFMDFLETFNQATLASPWLDAINLASFAFMTLPTAVSQVASIALALAVEVAKNMQSRHRYSNILDQMNNDFYRPRGLYALVLTWNPESDDMKVGIDLTKTIAKNVNVSQGVVQNVKHSLRPSMGNTIGVAFSETAPLIFPTLNRLGDDHGHENQGLKQKAKHAKAFVGDYFDRRAQAEHAGQNPESQLVVGPKPVFTSRYSDPNNVSNSGDLLALVTGGNISLSRGPGLLEQRRNMMNDMSYRRQGLLLGIGQRFSQSGWQQQINQRDYQQDYQRYQGPNDNKRCQAHLPTSCFIPSHHQHAQ